MSRPLERRRRRGGFTLVELLVVIAIIITIAGFLLVAVFGAFGVAEERTKTMTLKQIETAMAQVNSELGGYPPSTGVNQQALQVALRRAFPRAAIPNQLDVPGRTLQWNQLDAAECWVFFVGGLPQYSQTAQGTTQITMSGFAKNPQNPFQSAVDNPNRQGPFMEFQPDQLRDRDNDGWPEYHATKTAQAPIVYFSSRDYLNGVAWQDPIGQAGTAAPYSVSGGTGAPFHKPQTFQIIEAGADGIFGAGPGIALTDADNLTNFTSGTIGETLE